MCSLKCSATTSIFCMSAPSIGSFLRRFHINSSLSHLTSRKDFGMAKASMLDNVLHPTMQERVEIDTSLPFQSVIAAVSMFGERVDMKKSRTAEKNGAKEAEVRKLKEELAILKLQLAEAEKERTNAFTELTDTKKLLEEERRDVCVSNQSQTSATLATNGMQQDGLNVNAKTDADIEQNKTSIDVSKQTNPNAEEKHVVWEVELKVAQEQHMNAVAELESTKKELGKLKKELTDAVREKENALRQAEEALMSAELNARRVEELSHEISGTNESLVLVKLACVEASKEHAALLAATAGPSSQHQSAVEHDIGTIQHLEIQLAVATKELVRLQQELSLTKEAEVKVATAASGAYANLAQAKSELEKMRLQTSNTSASSSTLSSELKMTKCKLEKALENGVSLQASMAVLQSELEGKRKELANLSNREANASAALVTLSAELSEMKADLASAIAAENKANEALVSLTQTVQQIKVEADEEKRNADILKEEISKARADEEHAKDAIASAQGEVKVAVKAAEAAKAAECEALKKFNALVEKMSVVHASGVETGEDISISLDEYEQLQKKVKEAEELADMQVAVANAQVEAAKMVELDLEQKLKMLNDDIETMKKNMLQALQRAEVAESAKLAVESEMRRWREKKHHTKKVDFVKHMGERVEMDASVQKAIVKMGSSGKSQALSYSNVSKREEVYASMQKAIVKMGSGSSKSQALPYSNVGKREVYASMQKAIVEMGGSSKSQAMSYSYMGRREEGDASMQKAIVKMGSGKSQYTYVPPTESLSQILNMKMPALENDARSLSSRAFSEKKKKHYLTGLNIFSSKKNWMET